MKFLRLSGLRTRSVSFAASHQNGGVRGFSLVEVVMALGIVAFAMLSIVGLLPLGLDTVKESMNQTVTASIAQEIRGELRQISFLSTNTYNIDALCAQTYAQYYTMDGIKTTASDAEAFYKAAFANLASETAAGATFAPAKPEDPYNAKNITVTLSYPLNAPETKRKNIVFSLFIAKQTSD